MNSNGGGEQVSQETYEVYASGNSLNLTLTLDALFWINVTETKEKSGACLVVIAEFG